MLSEEDYLRNEKQRIETRLAELEATANVGSAYRPYQEPNAEQQKLQDKKNKTTQRRRFISKVKQYGFYLLAVIFLFGLLLTLLKGSGTVWDLINIKIDRPFELPDFTFGV